MPAQPTNLFVLQDLEDSRPVCPFVPRALELKTLWLAAERIADHGAADLVQLIDCYKRLLLNAKPVDGDDAHYKAIVVVFSDLSADRAADSLGDSRIQDLKRLAYAEDGVVMGEFHPRNEGSAIRSPSFHPFKAPVPFMLMRQAVVSDWMFFLDNDDWLSLWARRFSQDVSTTARQQMRRALGRPA